MVQPPFQPGEALEVGSLEGFRATLGKSTPRQLHILDEQLVRMKHGEKRAITTRGFAQELEIASNTLVDHLPAHVLEVDRDFRARDIDTESRLGSSSTPGVCREDVRSGEIRWLIRRQNRH